MLRVPSPAADRLVLARARGQGWAEGHAPEVANHLAVARSVLWAGGATRRADRLVHAEPAEAVADTAKRAALLLAGTSVLDSRGVAA